LNRFLQLLRLALRVFTPFFKADLLLFVNGKIFNGFCGGRFDFLYGRQYPAENEINKNVRRTS
jgi:hypothetical protein